MIDFFFGGGDELNWELSTQCADLFFPPFSFSDSISNPVLIFSVMQKMYPSTQSHPVCSCLLQCMQLYYTLVLLLGDGVVFFLAPGNSSPKYRCFQFRMLSGVILGMHSRKST